MKESERLTEKCYRNLDPWECCGQDSYCKHSMTGKGGCNNGCVVPRNYCRLAEYENTALSPAEIEQMKKDNAELKEENAGLKTDNYNLELKRDIYYEQWKNAEVILKKIPYCTAESKLCNFKDQIADLQARLDKAVEFLSKLILLCEVPQDKRDLAFRRIPMRAGDYMGSGYAFIDEYREIYDNFMFEIDNKLFELIRAENAKQQEVNRLEDSEGGE